MPRRSACDIMHNDFVRVVHEILASFKLGKNVILVEVDSDMDDAEGIASIIEEEMALPGYHKHGVFYPPVKPYVLVAATGLEGWFEFHYVNPEIVEWDCHDVRLSKSKADDSWVANCVDANCKWRRSAETRQLLDPYVEYHRKTTRFKVEKDTQE